MLLYVMLSGRPPFIGEGSGEIIAKHIYEEPPSLSGLAAQVPQELLEQVTALLRKDKLQRPTMRAVVEVLDRISGQQPGFLPGPVRPLLSGISRGGKEALLDQPSTLGFSSGQSRTFAARKHRSKLGLISGGVVAVALYGIAAWQTSSPQALSPPQLMASALVQPARRGDHPITTNWGVPCRSTTSGVTNTCTLPILQALTLSPSITDAAE